MAKGGGGEGHYDERRRALKPTTGFPDDPAVLQAISKPRAKPAASKPPVVVIKKKKPMPMAPPKKLNDVVGAKGDRLPTKTGSLFGLLNDNYNPFPASLKPIAEARSEAAASAAGGGGRRFEDVMDRRRAARKSYMF